MKVVVLGAGVVGVATAYYLNKRGHDVTVIERQGVSAAECSFANGGQLSYSHAEPWAAPSLLPKIPKWLMQKDSPLVFNLRADPDMWLWTMKFLACCNSKKAMESTKSMVKLALYSRECFAEVDSDIDFTYSKISKGTIHTFKCQKSLEHNIQQAKFQKDLGCDYEVLSSREACEAIEPALKSSPANIIGGLYFPMDETGDVNEFTVKMSRMLEGRGVKFEYNTTVQELFVNDGKISAVKTDKGEFKADSYVLSLGAYSSVLLRKAGIKVPIYPMKGYSVSVKIENSDAAPTMGVTDQSNKIVYSRLGNIMRVAGTAEFAGYNDKVKKSRIDTIKKMIGELFPDAGNIGEAGEWACLRPSTPDGSPIIGKTKYANLFLNTGHGTLGWTLSCGSAKAAVDVLEGKAAEVDLGGFSVSRF